MNHRHPAQNSGTVHQSVAVSELVDRPSDYDTSSSAWIAFDRCMTQQLVCLEDQMRRYFTPIAVRQDIGR